MRLIIAQLLLISLLPINAHSMIFGGSNFGFQTYPDHNCLKPSKPIQPYSVSNQSEINTYNLEVDLYNSRYKIYIDCVSDYVENANYDIERIKEKAQDAIDEVSY